MEENKICPLRLAADRVHNDRLCGRDNLREHYSCIGNDCKWYVICNNLIDIIGGFNAIQRSSKG